MSGTEDANTGCINPVGSLSSARTSCQGSPRSAGSHQGTGCAKKVGLEIYTTWRRFRAHQVPQGWSGRGDVGALHPLNLEGGHQGVKAHLSAPSLPSFPMALLFKAESLEWPSLTGGDSCQEKGVLHHYTGSLSPASLAFTVCLPLNGPLL